jgi:UDP-glucose 4-epimerase
VRALLSQGRQVRVFDNLSTGKMENLAGLDGHIDMRVGDLRDPSAVLDAARDVDVIFHEAAFVSVPQSMLEPETCFDVNVRGTENLLEAARRQGVRRVVFASSAAVYGDSEDLPLREDAVTRSLSPYAASKRINEILADLYTRAFGVEVVGLRYFNVFGPRQNPDSVYAAAVPIFIRRLINGQPMVIYGDGLQTRDMIYVGDVVRANLMAEAAPDAPGRAFNVCTGIELTVRALTDMLLELFPGAPQTQYAPPRAGDIYKSVGSPHLAEAALGFLAETPLLEGLRETVAWMRR